MTGEADGPATRIWFNETWRGTYQLIGLLRAGAGRRLTVLGSHTIASTPFLQACDEVIDEPREVGDAFVETALAMCHRYQVDVFVPNREMLAVAQQADRFKAAGVALMCSPAEAVEIFTTKSRQYTEMASRGLPVPRAVPVRTLAEFRAAYAALVADGLPVCFKPDVDHGGQGFRMIVPDAEDLPALLAPPSVRVGLGTVERILGSVPDFPALMVGQYLCGPEYSVDVLSDDGRLLAAVPRGKSGLPWTRELVDDPEVIELTRRVVAAFGLSYLSNVQIRYDHGRPAVLEVNPRAASGSYQSAAAGVNLPWLALRLALGLPFDGPEPTFPHTLIAYTEAMPMRSPRPPAQEAPDGSRPTTGPARWSA
ncbi:MAG: ATP-grasp domain-containing protein [Frankia sp.]